MRDQPTGEQEALEHKRAELMEKARGMFDKIFDSNSESDRNEAARAEIYTHLETEPTATLLDEESKSIILQALETKPPHEEKEDFISFYVQAVQPLIKFRVEHAKKYEDIQVSRNIKDTGERGLNERINYDIKNGHLQLHLQPSFEVKDKIENYYRDALYKIVDIVKNDPTILLIGGPSWLNATKTYGTMKERLGFTLSEIPQDAVKPDLPSELENRPMKNAYMTREEFLKLYSED